MGMNMAKGAAVNQLDQLDNELEQILTSFDSNYAWNYGNVKEGLRDLYEKAKREQWNGTEQLAWTTSWGVSTRLIGGIIMAHSDDDGFVLPPRLAPTKIVILPLMHSDESRASVLEYCDQLKAELSNTQYDGEPLEVEVDTRDLRGGEKMWSWIKKGVPLWLEIGPREVEGDSVFMGRRDIGSSGRVNMSKAEFVAKAAELLDDIQNGLLERARKMRESNTRKIDSKGEFYDFFTPASTKKPEIHGGFALCHWNGSDEVEETVKSDLNVTIRCIPSDAPEESGKCVITGEPSKRRVIFAKAY